jgi:hypothetical protein
VVTAPAANFRFVVSPPPAEDGDAGRTLVDAAIGSLFAESSGALGISRGEPGDPDADLILRIRNGRLWILRPDRPWVETPGAFDETPSFPLTGGAEVLAMSLEESVFRLARAARLLRVASSLAEGSAVDEEEGLAVSAKIVRAAQGDPKQACPKQPPAAGAVDPLLPLLPVKAGNCDLIEIEVRNEGERDYYISGFYVDSLGGIAVIPQSSEKSGCVRTLPMGTDKPLGPRQQPAVLHGPGELRAHGGAEGRQPPAAAPLRADTADTCEDAGDPLGRGWIDARGGQSASVAARGARGRYGNARGLRRGGRRARGDQPPLRVRRAALVACRKFPAGGDALPQQARGTAAA